MLIEVYFIINLNLQFIFQIFQNKFSNCFDEIDYNIIINNS